MSIWERLFARFGKSRRGAHQATEGFPRGDSFAEDPHRWLSRFVDAQENQGAFPKTIPNEVLEKLQMLWERGEEDLAIRWGRSFVQAAPSCAEIAKWVGQALCKKERFSEAVGPLAHAVTLVPVQEKCALWLRLAEMYDLLGQDEEAHKALLELLLLDFHHPEAQKRFLQQRNHATKNSGPLFYRGGHGFVAAPPIHTDAETDPQALGQRTAFATVAISSEDRFLLLTELGVGRMGTVFRALDKELGKEVALKVFHPHVRKQVEDDALFRALHEAKLLSWARHPGIVALHVLSDSEPSGALPFLVMELCRGGSLRHRLGRASLSFRIALLRMRELLWTLSDLHAGGVSHGDIKPENLLFRGDGRNRFELPEKEQEWGDLLLADFGVSRLENTQHGAGQGTRRYLSKERLLGAPPSPPSDVYSVGIVLSEMLANIQTETQVPLDVAERDFLQELQKSLLCPDPERRPTAKIAASEIEGFLEGN